MREGWTYKKLGEIGDIVTGSTPSTKDSENYSSKDFCFIKPSDLPSDSIGWLSSSENYLSEKGFSQSRHLPKGTVLVSCIGSIGKIGILEVEAATNQQINAIIPNNNIDSVFLAYSIFSIKEEMANKANAPVVPIINKKDFSNFQIPIPPLAEQERIVAELDLLSSIIEKKKAQLKEYDQLAQSIFYDMFGDPITNEKGWEMKSLGGFCEIKGRIGFRGYTKNDFVSNSNEGAISLSPTNIVNGSMDYSKCSYVTWDKYFESPEIMIQNGDILLVKTGSSYGKCSLVRQLPHEATINPQFVVIKDIKQNNIYLTFVLSSDYAKYQYDRFVLGTAIPTFSQKSLSSLPIPLPPLPLQQEFASKVEAIERQKSLIQQSIVETQTLFDSRMDYWFG